MTKFSILTLATVLGILVTAILTVQRYMSLPPNSGEDMALIGLPYRCVVYGVPCGMVGGLGLVKIGERLPQRRSTLVARSTRRRLAFGAGAVGVLLLVVFLFYGKDNTKHLAATVRPLTGTARKQGFVAVWNRTQPDLLVIDLAPHSYARIEDKDNATWYYLAFCHARHAAGYSVVSSFQCEVYLRLPGLVETRRSLRDFLVGSSALR
jgi:hypothetical protein